MDKLTASRGLEVTGWSILVHGGAGNVPEASRVLHAGGCAAAVRAGGELLARGGSALDAAQRAVEVLEDDPRFNAGTGAALTRDGHVELDAAVMEGTGLRAGAVCALPPFLHPITIARAALDDGAHVLYAGQGAERFALEHGFVRADEAAMIPPRVRERFERDRDAPAHGWAGGTVGAVARDARGGVASATSTGGTFFKRAGRVGDTPVLGAGTYADDQAGAVSATGVGEAIMRVCLGKAAVEWMRQALHPEEAARAAIQMMLDRTGSPGGLILVDAAGRLAFARSTVTMSWAAMADGWTEPQSGY